MMQFPLSSEEKESFRDFEGRIPIIGYGSLMSPTSAGREFAGFKIPTKVRLFGVKRVFNRDVWPGKKESAMLDLLYSNNPAHWVNAVLYFVDEKELAKLLKRELGYDVGRVSYENYETGEKGEAYAFMAIFPETIEKYTSKDVVPVSRYLNLCLKAAQELGDDFYADFIETTFLADEETLLKDVL